MHQDILCLCPDRIPASFLHRKLFFYNAWRFFFIEEMNTLFSEKTTQVIFRWHGTTIPRKGDRLFTETEYRQPLGIRPGAMFCLSPSLPESEVQLG